MRKTTQSLPTGADRHRFHFLDALRGVAAIAVVLYHMPESLGIRRLLPNGFLAVDFFFCLSGFVIAFSYQKRLQEGYKFSEFFVRRIIRLYPLYLLGTVLGFFVMICKLGLTQSLLMKSHLLAVLAISFFLMPAGFLTPFAPLFPLNDPAWSLFYEFFISLAFAWLVICSGAKTWTLAGLALVAGTVLLWWCSTGRSLEVGWATSRNHVGIGVARVIMSFCVGVLILLVSRRWVTSRTRGIILPFGVTMLLLLAMSAPLPLMHGSRFQFFAALVIMPTIVYFGSRVELPSSFTSTCVVLGEISYPLYLLHRAIFFVLFRPRIELFMNIVLWNKLPLVFVALAIAMTLCYFIGTRLDKPFGRYLSAASVPQASGSAAAGSTTFLEIALPHVPLFERATRSRSTA